MLCPFRLVLVVLDEPTLRLRAYSNIEHTLRILQDVRSKVTWGSWNSRAVAPAVGFGGVFPCLKAI